MLGAPLQSYTSSKPSLLQQQVYPHPVSAVVKDIAAGAEDLGFDFPAGQFKH